MTAVVTRADVTAVILMSGPLMDAGWVIGGPCEDGRVIRRADGRWPDSWPHPRIVVRPVGRRLWWHWAEPATIAGIPIAPVSDCDRTLRLLRATLAKLAARADVVGAAPP